VPVLSLDALLVWPDTAGSAVAVTFDDAIATARLGAEQLLAAGLPVTVFAVSGRIGQTNAWHGQSAPGIPTSALMDWADLELLRAHGAEIAPHTRQHHHLTTLSNDALDEEVAGSIEDLRRRLGTTSQHFAYPYGDVDSRVAARVARHCRWGYTADFRPLGAGDQPMWLPRLDMYYFNRPEALDAWATAGFSPRIHAIRARRWLAARVLHSRPRAQSRAV
jgi:peptidoglycan/xylan/chitin deacetylase (PgdA/CDA1 family)